jgi:hypothetical protein
MKTAATMLMSLALAFNALACDEFEVNPALSRDCLEVAAFQMSDGSWQLVLGGEMDYERKPPTVVPDGSMAVRVYLRTDENTMKFLGWKVEAVSEVDWYHNAKNVGRLRG